MKLRSNKLESLAKFEAYIVYVSKDRTLLGGTPSGDVQPIYRANEGQAPALPAHTRLDKMLLWTHKHTRANLSIVSD